MICEVLFQACKLLLDFCLLSQLLCQGILHHFAAELPELFLLDGLILGSMGLEFSPHVLYLDILPGPQLLRLGNEPNMAVLLVLKQLLETVLPLIDLGVCSILGLNHLLC